MSEGFEILEYKLLPDDAANAMSIVAAADYSLVFRPGYEPEKESPEEWFEKLVRFFDADHVMIMKKTKKGEREMDLKPFVYELNVRKNGEVPALFMKVSAGSAANIKPELVLDAYYASLGEERPQFAFMTEREEVYADTATAEEAEAGTHKFCDTWRSGTGYRIMDKLVITRLQGKICTASVSDRKVTGITLEEEDKASILNNIYIGKVQKVVTGINAAFVDLGVTIGYYSLDENKEHLFTQQGRNVN